MAGQYEQQLAKMLKEKPILSFQPTIAEVIKAFPELTLSILNNTITLYPEMLYMNDHLFDDYTRDYELTGEIDEITINTSSSNSEAGPGPHLHPHGIIKGKGKMKSKGTIINIDTLVIGDKVMVIPIEKGQVWTIAFKVRKVKE